MIRTRIQRLYRRLERAGVPRSLSKRMMPHWADDKFFRTDAGFSYAACAVYDFAGVDNPLAIWGDGPLQPTYTVEQMRKALDARDEFDAAGLDRCRVHTSKAGNPVVFAWNCNEEDAEREITQ